VTLRDRRALVLGGTVVAVAVGFLRVLPWGVRRVVTASVELRERSRLLEHARADLAAAGELRDSTAVLTRGLVALAAKLLAGNSAAEATADLSGRLNLAASRSQANLERLDSVPDSVIAGRLRRLSVHVALECDVRGLAGLLHAVETGDAALTVVDLQVAAADPASGGSQAEVLKVEITVAGWYVAERERAMGSQ